MSTAVERVCSAIVSRAECVERNARYDHELEYARGLRDAAGAIAGQVQMNNAWSVVHQMWRDSKESWDWRSGCRRALLMIEGEQDSEVNWGLFERIETAIQELRAEVWGLAAQVAPNVDVRDKE